VSCRAVDPPRRRSSPGLHHFGIESILSPSKYLNEIIDSSSELEIGLVLEFVCRMPELTPINRSFPRRPCRPNPRRFRPSKLSSSSRQAEASHIDSMLGGRAPACTAAARANLRAEAPLGGPLSPRSHRWKPCHIWCPVAELAALPTTGHGTSPVLYSADAVRWRR
jgi:hypothetical protein